METDIIGYAAGIFILVSFLAQVIKSSKTKSVGDLSYGMIIATLIGTLLWIVYSTMIDAVPIFVMNVIFGITVSYLLFLKVKYGKQAKAPKN